MQLYCPLLGLVQSCITVVVSDLPEATPIGMNHRNVWTNKTEYNS